MYLRGEEDDVLEKAKKTELTEFFEYTCMNLSTDHKYVDSPKKFV